ncbi:hypothetical protein HDZ31DRAFT_30015 [Schizophyllum fasciatum]
MPALKSDAPRPAIGAFSAFPQPSTIGVTPHIVDETASWPIEVKSIASAFTREDALPNYVRKLRRFFASYPLPPDGTVHLELPDPGCPLLRRLIPVCFASSALYNDASLRFSGLSSRVAVPYLASLFRALQWPDSRIAVDELFARPIDPCCFDDPNAAFQPPYMVADCLLLLSVPWVQENATPGSECASQECSTEEGLPSAADGASYRTSSSEYSQESSLIDGPPPYTHLLSLSASDQVEIPFVCVSSAPSLYILMASAILQRRALGIRIPVIGIALDTNSSTARIALGWYEPSRESCVSIHVAHCSDAFAASSDASARGAKQPTREERRARGVFDLREPLEALELALVVASLHEYALDLLNCAKIGLDTTASVGFDDPAARWRLVDAGRDTDMHVATPEYLKSRMYEWLLAARVAQ